MLDYTGSPVLATLHSRVMGKLENCPDWFRNGGVSLAEPWGGGCAFVAKHAHITDGLCGHWPAAVGAQWEQRDCEEEDDEREERRGFWEEGPHHGEAHAFCPQRCHSTTPTLQVTPERQTQGDYLSPEENERGPIIHTLKQKLQLISCTFITLSHLPSSCRGENLVCWIFPVGDLLLDS